MFYDRFVYLCKKKGVSPSRAATDAGISKSLVTKWKANCVKDPSPDVIRKLASYFNMSVAELLGEGTEKTPSKSGEQKVSEDDIKIALFGGDGEVTDEMWDEALFAVEMIKARHKRKKDNND